MKDHMANKSNRNLSLPEEDTPGRAFSREIDPVGGSITKLQHLHEKRIDSSFQERLKSAKQHLQRIEHKKQIIDNRQVWSKLKRRIVGDVLILAMLMF